MPEDEAQSGQKRLLDAEEWLALVVEGSGAGTWDHSMDLGRTQWSPRCRAIYGIPPGDSPNEEQFLEIIHPDDRHRVQQAIQNTLDPEVRAPYEIRYRIVWPDHSIRTILAKGKAFFSEAEGARATRFIGVVLDVTERGEMEDLNARLAAIIESTHDAILVEDLDGTITYCNPAAERLFGCGADEVVGGNIFQLIPPERVAEQREFLARIQRGEVVSGVHTEGIRKDGKRVTMSLTVSPLRDSSGKITGASKIAKDITAQLRLEEQLRQAQKMESIGQLAGGIAHDFNNLLTVINGFANRALAQVEPGSAIWQGVKNIETAGARAASLTQQLLAFSRKQVLQPKAVDLNKAIGDLKPLLHRLIREDILFITELHPDLPPVRVDPDQIIQVVMNLAINACDAMEAGGTLTIETKPVYLDDDYAKAHSEVAAGTYIELAVSDTGCGIARESMPHIFEPFFTTKQPGRGTGLGLSTVYGIVKQSHGHITVYSEEDVGTTFRVYLPIAQDFETVPVPKPKVRTLTGTEHILLVEDDTALREYAAIVLRDLGYIVHEAADGKAALELGILKRDLIDLVITDVIMPRMNGRELAQALAPHLPRLRVLYVSGYTENAIVQHGALEPGMQFLAKPYTPHQLGMKVREVLSVPLRRRTVLVVDDEPGFRELAKVVLSEAGYEVHEAPDGGEAISLCSREPIDLVITDLMMPGTEGIETIQYLAREIPHIPIIAVSGASQYLTAAQFLGAADVLAKPTAPAALLAAVRRIIG